MNSLPVKSAKFLICPSSLGIAEGQSYRTTDGKSVAFDFWGIWFGESESNLRALDYNCRYYFNTNFASVKALWKNRLGTISNNWVLYKMREV